MCPDHKKATLSLVVCACGCDMTKRNYDRSFISRVRVARESAGLSREDIAKELGIKGDTYARYELRIMMPHHHIPKFLVITGVSAEYLFAAHPAKQKAVISRA